MKLGHTVDINEAQVKVTKDSVMHVNSDLLGKSAGEIGHKEV